MQTLKEFKLEILSVRYFRFLVVSGTSVLVNILARAILGHWINYPSSIAIAYVFSTATAFALNGALVFKVTDHLLRRLALFVAVNLIGLIQTLIVSTGLLHLDNQFFLTYALPVRETACHVIALSTLAVTSFFLHKKFTFSEKTKND
jgi:putative flippase GtrA